MNLFSWKRRSIQFRTMTVISKEYRCSQLHPLWGSVAGQTPHSSFGGAWLDPPESPGQEAWHPQPWQREPSRSRSGLGWRSSESRALGFPRVLRRATVQAADGCLSVTPLLFPSSWLMNWKCSALGFPWGQTALLKMSVENAVNLSSLKMDGIRKCESSKKRCNWIVSVELPGCKPPAQRSQLRFA